MDNNKKIVLQALERHYGNVSAACNAVDMPRSTFYLWCKEDEEFKKAVDEIQEFAIDHVENKLFEKINGVAVATKEDSDGEPLNVYKIPPSDTAIIFYLKTKGKKRGYIEKTETGITDKDGNDVKPIIQLLPAPNCEPIK